MDVDLSTKELKAASTAFAVAAEIVRKHLGEGDCLEPGMLLRGFTEAQLREFVRICRELEGSLDGYLIPASAEYEGNDDGGVIIVQKTPPWVLREGREKRGGYR